MPEQHILKDILSNEKRKRKGALEAIYKKVFPRVKNYVLNNNGNLTEAEDVFQDAITIFYQNLLDKRFREEGSLNAYLFSIAKNVWLMELRNRKLKNTIQEDMSLIAEDERQIFINANLLQLVLNNLKENCRNVLTSFYLESKSMDEIAKTFGLGSAQAAKTKKLRCMKKLLEIVKGFDLKREQFMI